MKNYHIINKRNEKYSNYAVLKKREIYLNKGFLKSIKIVTIISIITKIYRSKLLQNNWETIQENSRNAVTSIPILIEYTYKENTRTRNIACQFFF